MEQGTGRDLVVEQDTGRDLVLEQDTGRDLVVEQDTDRDLVGDQDTGRAESKTYNRFYSWKCFDSGKDKYVCIQECC